MNYLGPVFEVKLSAKAQAAIGPVIKRFEPSTGERGGLAFASQVDPEQLPVPWLAHLVLVQVLGAEDLGIAEKVRWRVAFRFDGVEAMLAHQKFGVRLYLGHQSADTGPALVRPAEVVNKLNTVIRAVEADSLAGVSRQRVNEANVTVMNQHARLRRAYGYFRSNAEELLAASTAPDTGVGTSEDGTRLDELVVGPGAFTAMMAGPSRGWRRLEEGSFQAVAAINAYFSWLEHVLVLMHAFTRESPGNGRLRAHIGDKWGTKFRVIFSADDKSAAKVVSNLYDVAETYRNPFGHGGFDKRLGTVGVHLEGIGAVPARLTDIRRSPHFEVYPFGPDSFADVARCFDQTDQFLREGPMALAMRWVESGLDVPFDARSRQRIKRNMRTPAQFEAFIERCSIEVDDHLNMDH